MNDEATRPPQASTGETLRPAKLFGGPFWDAVKTKNLAKIDELFADGLILFEPFGNQFGREGGGPREGAEGYKGLIQTVSGVRVDDFSARELEFRVDDASVVLLNGHFKLSATFPGGSREGIDITYRGEWRKGSDGAWRMSLYVAMPTPDNAAARAPFLPYADKLRAALAAAPNGDVHVVEELTFDEGRSKSVVAKVKIGGETAAVSAHLTRARETERSWQLADFVARLDQAPA